MATIALLFLIVCVGIGYTIYQERHLAKTAIEKPDVIVPTDVNPIKPPTIGVNVPEGAAIETLTSQVVVGGTVIVNVKTNPLSTCTIAVGYDKVFSKGVGLLDKVADDFGVVSWTWNIDKTIPEGSWPLNVNCSLNKQSAFVQAYILVTKP